MKDGRVLLGTASIAGTEISSDAAGGITKKFQRSARTIGAKALSMRSEGGA
jgi:hypothetical protein